MNKTANCKVIKTHWVYSHRYVALQKQLQFYRLLCITNIQ